MDFSMLYEARSEIKPLTDESEDLISRARSGDDEAFGVIFEHHSRFIYKFIYAMIGDRSAAEELTQETFLAAYKSIHGLRGDAQLRTWLCAIAKNVVYKSLRSRRKEGMNRGEQIESLGAADDKNLPPDREFLSRELNHLIHSAPRKRLFEPLGMRDTHLHLDAQKHAWTYADMETSARDFARVGLLMLNNGLWQNRRIVSSEWIKKSTERSQQFENYGLLWWLYDEPKGFAAHGYLDTNLYVFPKQNLIVARMQSKPQKQYISHEKEALRLFGQLERK